MKRDRDPMESYVREKKQQRRVGAESCACGEARAHALVAGTKPTVCGDCLALAGRRRPIEAHHPAGRANDPATISLSINDHRTLTAAQYDWPSGTLRNLDASPLLAGAGVMRGLRDTVFLLLDQLERWAGKLEKLDELLRDRYGPRYWDDPNGGEP